MLGADALRIGLCITYALKKLWLHAQCLATSIQIKNDFFKTENSIKNPVDGCPSDTVLGDGCWVHYIYIWDELEDSTPSYRGNLACFGVLEACRIEPHGNFAISFDI
jgi:hypothetical protein